MWNFLLWVISLFDKAIVMLFTKSISVEKIYRFAKTVITTTSDEQMSKIKDVDIL
jgi:hypothetical protein